MSIVTTNQNLIQIVLNNVDTDEEFDYNQLKTTSFEFVVGGTFGEGTTVKLYRYLSDNAGYQIGLAPGVESEYEITALGSLRAMAFISRQGKFKFEAINPTVETNIKIDIGF